MVGAGPDINLHLMPDITTRIERVACNNKPFVGERDKIPKLDFMNVLCYTHLP